jgi:hypothetical protein
MNEVSYHYEVFFIVGLNIHIYYLKLPSTKNSVVCGIDTHFFLIASLFIPLLLLRVLLR